MESKICNKCGGEKLLIEYNKDNASKDKLKNTCKSCQSIIYREWANKNKKEKSVYNKEYRIKNEKNLKEYTKNYNENFKTKNNISRHTLWDRNNKDRRKELLKTRLKNDIVFSLKYKLRSSLNAIFRYKGFTKRHKSHDILGCSYEQFLIHLESQFEPWMNWDNKGLYNGDLNHGWDIDHIIPTSSANTEEELIKLCHYTNLQPLCSKINRDIKKNNPSYY